MEWLVVSALAFFIGTMLWVVYDIAFRQFPRKKKRSPH
jgi:hypothetical protein